MFKVYRDFLSYILTKIKSDKKIVILTLFSIVIHSVTLVLIPFITQMIIDYSVPNFGTHLSFILIVLLVLLPSISILLMTFEDYQANKLGHRVATSIQINIFRKYINQNLDEVLSKKTGMKLQRLIDEPEVIARWIYITSTQIIINFLAIVFMLIIMFFYDRILGIFSLLFMLIYAFPFFLLKEEVEKSSKEYLESRTNSNSILNENLNLMITFKSMGYSDFLLKRYNDSLKRNFRSFMKNELTERKLILINSSISSFALGFLFLYGGHKVISYEMTIGELIGAKMIIDNLFFRGKQLFYRIIETSKVIPIYNVLSNEERLLENNKSLNSLKKINSIKLSNIPISRQEITINIPTRNFNLILGPSGIGKSTILFYLARLNIPQTGSIYINGIDYRNFNEQEYNRKILIVPQNIELINGTIREVLTFSNSIDMELVEYYIKKSK